MAVFICECCGATLKKNQIDRHCETKCRNAWAFTCVECGLTFEGFDYKNHNMCMTEVEKYQGKFLERQRQAKLAAKSDKKITKATGQTAAAEEETKVEKEKKKRKGSIADEEASAK